jgi:hypothetical protein
LLLPRDELVIRMRNDVCGQGEDGAGGHIPNILLISVVANLCPGL